MAATTFLNLSDVTVQYVVGGRHRNAVDNLSLDLPSAGYTLGLVGESGSGKTTLGMSIMGLIEPPGKVTSGNIEYMGDDVLAMDPEKLRLYRWKEVSMIYQSAMNSLNPVKTISGHITEVLRYHTSISKSEAREKAMRLLSQVGIKVERAHDYPHEFSGGMRQRAVIAMALALSPKLLIADEPTSALDVVVQKQILSLLKNQITKQGHSLLFITHELAILTGLVEYVAVMYEGEIVERGSIDKVLFEPLHPYTEMLVGSILTLDSSITALGGSAKASKGAYIQHPCKYAHTCKYAFERCRVEKPKLTEIEKGRWVACHKYS